MTKIRTSRTSARSELRAALTRSILGRRLTRPEWSLASQLLLELLRGPVSDWTTRREAARALATQNHEWRTWGSPDLVGGPVTSLAPTFVPQRAIGLAWIASAYSLPTP